MSNQYYSQDTNDYHTTEPLMYNTSTGSSNGGDSKSRQSGDLEGGVEKGGMSRRREENRFSQFPENYTYASSGATAQSQSEKEANSQNQRQQLKSLTFGGLGPMHATDIDDNDLSKYKTQKLHIRLRRKCSNCLRASGCSSHAMVSQEGPNGDYYRDDFNDQTHNCSVGTSDEDGLWMNRNDAPGSIMALMVWFLFLYSAVTITFLAETGGINGSYAMLYVTLTCMALASHAKTTFTDPGTVPASAQPVESLRKKYPNAPLTMCSQCQTFKPPFSHHCRICNRCISRMDHHCPWMNNCVGAGNLKHFTLFLIYTWLCNCMALVLLGWNYFFCVTEDCTFNILLVQLARITTFLSAGSILFTSSMIMNVTYGLMTGIGTIDRLKKKAMDTMIMSEEEPIPLKDVFGIAGYHTWFFPVDPVFEDFDRVMGFSTAQRLLREQIKEQPSSNDYYSRADGNASVITQSTYDDDIRGRK